MEENPTYNMPQEEEGIDIVGLVRQLWEGKRTIIICTSVFIVLGLVMALTMKRTYSVSSTMVPPWMAWMVPGSMRKKSPALMGQV